MSRSGSDLPVGRSRFSLVLVGALFGLAVLAMTIASTPTAAWASPGAVTVNSASIDRIATTGKLSYSVSASASGYWLANNTGTCIGNGSCTLTLQTQLASSIGTLASTTATGSVSGFSHTFSGSTAMTQITAVRLVLTGGGGTITGSWFTVSDPYPTPTVSVSVASVGRSATTGKLTWDITATAANYALLDSACPSNSSYTCYLRIEGKRVDGSIVQLAEVSNLYNQAYPYVFQSVSSLTATQITDVRARVFRTSSAPPALVGSWVAVSDPYPTPSATVSVTSVGRDPSTGKFTWDITATSANYALLDSACPSNSSYPCYLRIEGKRSDGSIVQLAQVSDLYNQAYPYQFHSVSSMAVTTITDVRARVFRTSSPPPELVGAWVPIADPYPTPSATVTGTIGRDALTGKLTWDLTATASHYALLDSACPSNSNSTCYMRIEARHVDGSVQQIAQVSNLYGAGSPYVLHSVGSLVTTEITDLRVRVFKDSGTSTPLIGWWEEFEDPYPVPEVRLEGAVGRDAATGKFAWDLTATAANFSLYDSACPTSHSGYCDLYVEARYSDGSIVHLASVSDLMTSSSPYVPTANPYVFHSVGSRTAGTITDIRATVTKNTLGTTTPLRGDWIPIRDAQGKFFVGGGNASMKGCQCSPADPVNTLNGDFYLPSTDIGLPGVGPAVAVSRTYSSLKSASNGPFGYGWSANFTTKLTLGSGTPLPSYVDVVQENGAITTFTLKNGEYPSDPWVLATLTRDSGSGEWTFVRDHRETFVFDSTGLLLEISDVHGTTVAYGRNGSGQVTSITGTGGREINLTWTSGRVTGLSDSAGRTASFTYDGNGNLGTATAVDGAVWTYGYTSLHLMTTLTSPEGGVTTNVFDAVRRAISQTDEIGRVTTFAYGALSTTTTFPGGSQTVEKYDQGTLVETIEAAGTSAEAATSFEYDDAGNLAATTDALGNVTSSTFDSAGNALTTTDPLGRTTTRTFDSLGNVTSIEDPLGRLTELTYNAAGDLTSLTTPSGHEQTWTVNLDGTVASQTDGRNKTTTNTYDAAGRVLCTTDPVSRERCVEYDGRGFVVGSTDSADAETVYTHDNKGRVLTVIDPNNSVTTTTYDVNGNPLSVVDPNGKVIMLTYDEADQVSTSTDQLGEVTSYTYSPRGEVATTTNPTGDVVSTTYDAQNRLATVTDGENRTTTYGYDLVGRVVSTTLPSTAVTTTSYDDAGQAIATTDALGNVTHREYDDAGQLVAVVDALNRTTEASYTDDGLVGIVTYPDASIEVHEYNANAQETSFINADGAESTYAYDDAGLLVAKTEPSGLETTYAYDAAGRLADVTTPDGHTSSRSYDGGGRITDIDYPGAGDDVEYTYDPAGRRLTMVDDTGTTTYTYTDAGQIASVQNGNGESLAYAYDDSGQLITVTYPGNHDVEYTYDDAGQMTSVTGWSSGTTTYSYTADGYLSTRGDPNGVTETRDYDLAGRISGIVDVNTLAIFVDYEYAYDDAGQVINTTMTDVLHTASTQNWGYDSIGQLTSTAPTATYAASSAGLLTATPTGDSLTYNSAGQLTHVVNVSTGVDSTLSYDGNGARVGSVSDYPTDPDRIVGYEFNEAGSLVGYADGNVALSYTVDGTGLRQARGDGATTKQFLWDTVAALPLLLSDGDYTYIYGPSPTPIAQINSLGAVEYLYADNIGSVRSIADDSGTVVSSTDFDAFGNVLSQAGAGNSRIGYGGAWTDDASGLVYLRARDYDPKSGQFLTVDPLVTQTRHPYTYASNRPLDNTDPTGLCDGFDCLSDSYFWSGLLPSINEATRARNQPILNLLNPDNYQGPQIAEAYEARNKGFAEFSYGVGDGATSGGLTAVSESFAPGSTCWIDRDGFAYNSGTVVGVAAIVILTRKAVDGDGVGRPPSIMNGAAISAELRALPGGNGTVRLAASEDELMAMWNRYKVGGQPISSTYSGNNRVQLPDGTTVGLRTSSAHGLTLDVRVGRTTTKVHIDGQ